MGFIGKIKNWRMARKIESGKVPRGRTVAIKTTEEPEEGGGLVLEGSLSAIVIRHDGQVEDKGVICRRLVTQAFANYLVDAMQNSSSYPMDVFKYHQSGTGTTPESNTQTDLVTPVGSRVSGSQTEGSSSNIYKTVATINYTGTYSITEHGVFSASSGGTLLDRSVFSAINVISGDSIEFTYQLTVYPES